MKKVFIAVGHGGDNYYDAFWDAYQENGNRTYEAIVEENASNMTQYY